MEMADEKTSTLSVPRAVFELLREVVEVDADVRLFNVEEFKFEILKSDGIVNLSVISTRAGTEVFPVPVSFDLSLSAAEARALGWRLIEAAGKE
jgi:hypothetical protein